MILWRQLLDAVSVRWIDRGHNTSRGHVNIPCPWCGTADPSYHLGIEEATGAYYCLRSQPPHAGRSVPFLLMTLGVPSFQIDALLREFSDDSTPTRTPRAQELTNWSQFKSAADHPAALTYLRARGFDPPAVLARRYDMRFTTSGKHSWRILLPLRLNTEIIGWTGRDISNRQPQRYLTSDPSGGGSLYVPVYPTEATQIVIVVEGPFDAIAISDSYPDRTVIAIALTGLQVNPIRRQHLADVIRMAGGGEPRVLLTLDRDQETNIKENLKEMLARGTGIPYPENFPVPPSFKDAGEMSHAQIQAWLKQLPPQQRRGGTPEWKEDSDRNGTASSKTGPKPI